MAVTNPSFENAGAHEGEAAGWTLTASAALEDFATYERDDGGPLGQEAFTEGWGLGDWSDALGAGDVDAALYGATDADVEEFGAGWTTNWSAGLGSHVFADYDGDASEEFDAGWTDGWGDSLDSSSAGSPDTFEAGWANDTWQTAFGGGDLEAATYDPGALSYEGFPGTDWGAMTTF